jgi:hypothetical protein
MTATLFEMPTAGFSGAPVAAYRAELERATQEAIRACVTCETCSPRMIDRERAVDMMRGLAGDGETSWARSELLECIDLDYPGAGAVMDELRDHLNCVGLAYWRLYRAERRRFQP